MSQLGKKKKKDKIVLVFVASFEFFSFDVHVAEADYPLFL